MEVNIHPYLKTLLKVLFAGIVLTVIVRSGHLDLKVLRRLFTDPASVVVLLSLAMMNLLILTIRWWWIVNDTIKPFSLSRSLKLNLIGNFFNFIFPSSIGGDVVRGFYLAQDFPNEKMKSALSVVFDRLIGLYSLIGIACFSLLYISTQRWNSSLGLMMWSTLCLFAVFTAVLVLIASGWMKIFLEKIKIPILRKPVAFFLSCHDYIKESLRNPKLIFKTVLAGVLAQSGAALFFFVVAQFMGESRITFMDLMSITPLGFLAMSIPISPAGIGVGQVAYLFLITQLTGETSEFGPTAISAFQISLLFWSLLGGWFYLTLKKPKELES